jgi:DNA end-binding protein Ku
MAAIWKGSLTLGLVNVPVELRPAVQPDHISFRLLHAEDNTPVKCERVRADNGKTAPWSEIARGYEYAKDRFIVLTDEDFKTAALEQSHSIDIMDFVAEDAIDPRFFETPYFLVPSRGGDRAYAVLRDAMREMHIIGIGTIILRKSQHLAGVHVVKDALVLELMRFENEIVPADQYALPGESNVRPAELNMAKQLLENLRSDFEPGKYTNKYRANLMRIINAKSKGKEPRLKTSNTGEQDHKVLDLMERLQASLRQGKNGKHAHPAKAAPKPASKAAPKDATKGATKRVAQRRSA